MNTPFANENTCRTATPAMGQKPDGAPAVSEIWGTDGLLDSQRLLQGRKAVTIAHNGTTYRLQATRQGKLILTK